MSCARDWALITGAGSGIGAALARKLAERGTGVVLIGRREASLHDVRASFGEKAFAAVIEADIASAPDRARMGSDVSALLAEQGGHLRYLIHNAGVGAPSPNFAGIDTGDLEYAFAVNVTAPLALTQFFLPALQKAKSARIMLVGAGIADRPQPGTGIYGITKKALARLFDQMLTDFDYEANPHLPSVAMFQPGMVDTEGLRAHVDAATACELPHTGYLKTALSSGDAQRPETVARAMVDALLDLPAMDYHGRTLRPVK